MNQLATNSNPEKKDPIRRRLRYLYLRFIRLQGDPATIARGVAVGLFVGVTPTIPLHTILTLSLALVCRGSKIAAMLASWLISNPLTFIPQYYFSWKIGNWLTAADLSWERVQSEIEFISSGAGFRESINALGHLGHDTLVSLVLGGCLLATPFALLGYFASLRFFSALQRKRRQKQVLN